MKRIWWVYALFVFAALWDLVLTLWNLYNLHYGFEGNPIIRNWWMAVLVKLLACVVMYFYIKKFDNEKLFGKICLIGTFLMLILGQLYGGYTHIPFLIKEHQSTNTILEDKNVTFTIEGEKIMFSIPESFKTQMKWYFTLLGILFIYPYIFMMITVRIALWCMKFKDDYYKPMESE